jgi:hypothetical protein
MKSQRCIFFRGQSQSRHNPPSRTDRSQSNPRRAHELGYCTVSRDQGPWFGRALLHRRSGLSTDDRSNIGIIEILPKQDRAQPNTQRPAPAGLRVLLECSKCQQRGCRSAGKGTHQGWYRRVGAEQLQVRFYFVTLRSRVTNLKVDISERRKT